MINYANLTTSSYDLRSYDHNHWLCYRKQCMATMPLNYLTTIMVIGFVTEFPLMIYHVGFTRDLAARSRYSNIAFTLIITHVYL